MVGRVKQLIERYESTLNDAELKQFKSMKEPEQVQIAIIKVNNATPTETGALSNLEAKQIEPPKGNIFPTNQTQTGNSTGLVLERKNLPSPEAQANLPKPEIKPEIKPETKTTKYVVQLGESVEDLVKKSLTAQGVKDITVKQFMDGIDKFKETNKGIINKKGYLIAGKEAILDGEVAQGEKTAREINDAWAAQHPKANPFQGKKADDKKAEHPAGSAPAGSKADDKKANPNPPANTGTAPAAPKAATPKAGAPKAGDPKAPATQTPVATPKVVSKKVPEAQLMKKAEVAEFTKKNKINIGKNGYFIKNDKKGTISRVYTRVDGARQVDTYDAKTGKVSQEDTYYLDKVSSTNHYDKDGNLTTHKQRNADGSSITNVHVSKGKQKEAFYKSIEIDKNGKETITDAHGKVITPAAGSNKAATAGKKNNYIVTPTADEVKGIAQKEGGRFIKNTKTGLISQIYTDPKNKIRTINTYDKDKKLTQKDIYRQGCTETHMYNKDGNDISSVNHYANGTTEFFKGDDGHGHYVTKSRVLPDGTKEYYADPDANGQFQKGTMLTPDGSKTEYTLNEKGDWIKGKTTPAPAKTTKNEWHPMAAETAKAFVKAHDNKIMGEAYQTLKDPKTGEVIVKSRSGNTRFEDKFDANGVKIQQIRYENGEKRSIDNWKYDNNGRISHVISRFGNGKIENILKIKYDQKGNRVQDINEDANGKVKNSSENKYDTNNILTQTINKDGNGRIKDLWEYKLVGGNYQVIHKNANGKVIE